METDQNGAEPENSVEKMDEDGLEKTANETFLGHEDFSQFYQVLL